jgi:hypothetical protein
LSCHLSPSTPSSKPAFHHSIDRYAPMYIEQVNGPLYGVAPAPPVPVPALPPPAPPLPAVVCPPLPPPVAVPAVVVAEPPVVLPLALVLPAVVPPAPLPAWTADPALPALPAEAAGAPGSPELQAEASVKTEASAHPRDSERVMRPL